MNKYNISTPDGMVVDRQYFIYSNLGFMISYVSITFSSTCFCSEIQKKSAWRHTMSHVHRHRCVSDDV